MTKEKKVEIIRKFLAAETPNPTPPLNHTTAHELLFAVILSAQSTDKKINEITPALFAKYPTVQAFADSDIDELKNLVRQSGFYNNKAKNIKAAAQMLVADFGGKVPDTMEELIKLPGVARKTANVVLWQWFKKNEGFAVDTHVLRLSKRLGLSDHTDPVKVEQDLMLLFPQEEWGATSLRLILHGRYVCTAKNPKCDECEIHDLDCDCK